MILICRIGDFKSEPGRGFRVCAIQDKSVWANGRTTDDKIHGVAPVSLLENELLNVFGYPEAVFRLGGVVCAPKIVGVGVIIIIGQEPDSIIRFPDPLQGKDGGLDEDLLVRLRIGDNQFGTVDEDPVVEFRESVFQIGERYPCLHAPSALNKQHFVSQRGLPL